MVVMMEGFTERQKWCEGARKFLEPQFYSLLIGQESNVFKEALYLCRRDNEARTMFAFYESHEFPQEFGSLRGDGFSLTRM